MKELPCRRGHGGPRSRAAQAEARGATGGKNHNMSYWIVSDKVMVY